MSFTPESESFLEGELLTDEELTEMALAAPRDHSLRPDAVACNLVDYAARSPLPNWYMPPAIALRHGRGSRLLVGSIVAGFLLINGLGLCATYGYLTIA